MPTLNLHFSSPEAKACADLEESPRHQLSTKTVFACTSVLCDKDSQEEARHFSDPGPCAQTPGPTKAEGLRRRRSWDWAQLS